MKIEQAGIDANPRPYADHQRPQDRWDAIMCTPEAAARHFLACALLLRIDLAAEYALMFLREAPELRTPAEIWAWVETISRQSSQETMQ